MTDEPQVDAVLEAVRRAAGTYRWVMGRAGESWGALDCETIEALADVFRAAGEDGVAEAIIDDHAEGDVEEHDAHHDRYLAIIWATE